MIGERTGQILEAAVREFIRTGEPISSGVLWSAHDFGIRPASIRHELHKLTEHGYLDQPYHSAGRVPSDKGYAFFVERVLHGSYRVPEFAKQCESFFRGAQWENLLQELSDELGVLGVVEDERQGEVYKEGLDDLVERLSWDSPAEIKEVIRDFEEIDERFGALTALLGENMINVFVGKRSPITKSKHLSVVAAEYGEGGGRVVLAAIGPKRMDYQKSIGVFKGLKHNIK